MLGKRESLKRSIQISKQIIINLILSVCFFQSFKLRKDILEAAFIRDSYAQISVQDIKAK